MITEQRESTETNASTDRHRFLQKRVNRLLSVRFFLERQGLALCIGVAGAGLLVPSMEAFQTGMLGLVACAVVKFLVERRLAYIGLRALQVSVCTAIVDPDEDE